MLKSESRVGKQMGICDEKSEEEGGQKIGEIRCNGAEAETGKSASE
jgi:hypothetical protein